MMLGIKQSLLGLAASLPLCRPVRAANAVAKKTMQHAWGPPRSARMAPRTRCSRRRRIVERSGRPWTRWSTHGGFPRLVCGCLRHRTSARFGMEVRMTMGAAGRPAYAGWRCNAAVAADASSAGAV